MSLFLLQESHSTFSSGAWEFCARLEPLQTTKTDKRVVMCIHPSRCNTEGTCVIFHFINNESVPSVYYRTITLYVMPRLRQTATHGLHQRGVEDGPRYYEKRNAELLKKVIDPNHRNVSVKHPTHLYNQVSSL